MNKCYDCRKVIDDKLLRCDECDKNVSIGREYTTGSGVHLSREGEIVTERILNESKKYAKDMVQPYRRDSDRVSREFVEIYPEKAKKMFTPEQIKKSKYLWK